MNRKLTGPHLVPFVKAEFERVEAAENLSREWAKDSLGSFLNTVVIKVMLLK